MIEALSAAADFAYQEHNKPTVDMFGAVEKAGRAETLNKLDGQNERTSAQNLEDATRSEPAQSNVGRQSADNAAAGDANAIEASGSTEAGAAEKLNDGDIRYSRNNEQSSDLLEAYTASDVVARQEAEADAQRQSKAKQAAQDAQYRKEQDRKEIAAKSVAAADTFELGGDAMDNLSGQDGFQFSRRRNSGNRLPNVVIGHKLGALNSHPDYAAAKAGDGFAAARIAFDLVNDEMVNSVRKAAGNAELIVPVVSVEATGRNKIPMAVARELADRLGSITDTEIIQADSPKRTNMDGLDRLLNPPVFSGSVTPGAFYVLVDDTVTQGGTFASLASHIRDNGGEVAGVVALTGKQYSAKMEPSPELLQQVRERFQSIEPEFRAATGYGFDALTESEARYLVKHDDAESVRARIVEAGRERINGVDRGVPEAAARKQSQSRTQPVAPRTPASVIRDAITKAYGNTLSRLEAKGLVTIAQTEDDAITAAAFARAEKMGVDFSKVKRQMLASVQMDLAKISDNFDL